MVRWNAPFEIEEVKQLTLIAALPTHHDPPPPPNESSGTESWHPANREPFFNIIGHKRRSDWVGVMSALAPKADIGTQLRLARFLALRRARGGRKRSN